MVSWTKHFKTFYQKRSNDKKKKKNSVRKWSLTLRHESKTHSIDTCFSGTLAIGLVLVEHHNQLCLVRVPGWIPRWTVRDLVPFSLPKLRFPFSVFFLSFFLLFPFDLGLQVSFFEVLQSQVLVMWLLFLQVEKNVRQPCTGWWRGWEISLFLVLFCFVQAGICCTEWQNSLKGDWKSRTAWWAIDCFNLFEDSFHFHQRRSWWSSFGHGFRDLLPYKGCAVKNWTTFKGYISMKIWSSLKNNWYLQSVLPWEKVLLFTIQSNLINDELQGTGQNVSSLWEFILSGAGDNGHLSIISVSTPRNTP